MKGQRLSISVLAVLTLCLALLPGAATAQEAEPAAPEPDAYTIDPGHTTIGFAVRHFTVSRVRGRFAAFEGTVRYDAETPEASSVRVAIDAASIDSAHEQRDNHLRSADFLDVENHPRLTFESTSVEKGDEGWRMTGNLTIRGVTREVSFPFEMVGPVKDPLGMMRMGVEARLTIDRRDWGLEWSRTMETGGLFVGHKVEIEITAEAARK